MFPKLRLLPGMTNDIISSEYKALPSALTKCLVQVRVRRFSGRFVRLMTQTQRFSRFCFLSEEQKVMNDANYCTCWSNILKATVLKLMLPYSV